MEFRNITFIVAMEAEAIPIIEAFHLEEDSSFGGNMPMRAWAGDYNGIHISLVTNGKDAATGLDLIGTQAATLATHLAIEKYQPQIFINAGTAGAFGANGSRIGDIYLSRDHVVFHDRRVPIPGWDTQSVGYYPVWNVSRLSVLGYKTGIVTTGNSLDMPHQDEESIRRLGGEVKEMEAAAVAWIAKLNNIPVFCVKAVTDLMDSGHPTHEEFTGNLQLATRNLRDACLQIIRLMSSF
jgi:5'-methylthioadenosine nucleosidase